MKIKHFNLSMCLVVACLFCTVSILGQNTWDGSADTDWDTAANWSFGTVPIATDNVQIDNVPNQPTMSGIIGLSATVSVEDGATLTIESDGGLTLSGRLTLVGSGAVIINSSSSDSGSLIIGSVAGSNVTYNRHVTGGGWYLISKPVSGTIASTALFNNHSSLFATGGTSTLSGAPFVNAAIAQYDSASGSWIYTSAFGTTGFQGFDISNGMGVSVRLISKGDITMSGGINTSSLTRTLAADTFNLLGNPYTASLNTEAFLTTNGGGLTENTVWVRSGSGYTAHNSVATVKIAPGQGFFVRANSSPSSASFNPNTLSHDAADTFGKSIPFATYELFLQNNGAVRSTRVFYAENRTTGFDNGSDSSLFSENDDFSIYTELVEGSDGQKLEIQTLPDTNIESFVVPVGVTAVADSEIIFSIEASNFDENIQITLEDRVTNTFTRLDEANSTYKVTTENALDGVGRFYMHTTQDALSVDTNEWLSTVQIYKVNNANLRITGLTQGEATVQMYNMLGKQVLSTSFDTMGTEDIAIPNDISKGIYFVKLETANGILNKKIILE